MKKNFIPVALISLALITMLAFWGCSKSTDPPDNGPTEEQLQQLEDIQQTQLEYYADLEDLLAEMDTAYAKDSIVAIMATDTLVEWALATSQGINIQYNIGMRGGFLLDPLRYDMEDSMRGHKGNYDEQEGMAVSGLVVPTNAGTRFLAPAFSEFINADLFVERRGNSAFEQVGFDNFYLYANSNCFVQRFTYLSDWGIIRISSHGIAWPSKTNIQEVYLMTGEEANRETNTEYFSSIETGDVPIFVRTGSNMYCISPAFFGMYNDLSVNKTVVSLGFCFSFLGSWPSTIIDECGASACLGYDWAVQADKDAYWTEDFFNQLCDTTRETPLTIGEWYPTIENTYYSSRHSRWVTILYDGDDSTALWLPLRITSIDPTSGSEDTIVTIRGIGFGDTEDEVRFDDVVATNISVWTDTLIRVAVPAGLTEGAVAIVKVVVDGMESNGVEFTIESGPPLDLSRVILLSVLIRLQKTTQTNDTTTTNAGGYGIDWLSGSFSGNTFYGYRDTINIWGDTEIIETATVTVDPIARQVTSFNFTVASDVLDGVIISSSAISGNNIPSEFGSIHFRLQGTNVCSHISNFESRRDDYSTGDWAELIGYSCDEYSDMEIYFYNSD